MVEINTKFMTFKEMMDKYPEMQDDLCILRTNINAKFFWGFVIAGILGLIMGVLI